jgi:hypothetical protein
MFNPYFSSIDMNLSSILFIFLSIIVSKVFQFLEHSVD